MKRIGIRSIVFMMMLAISGIACRRSPIEPAPIPQPQPGYTLFVVRVLDNTNVGVSNVNVEITGTTNYQAFTDSSGTVNTQLPYGSYNVFTAPFGFDGSSQIIELNAPNQELILNLLRRNAVSVISVEPPCGIFNLPYVFNGVTVKVNFSVAEPFEYPVFGHLDSALSTDGIIAIPNSGTGRRFGYYYQSRDIGPIENTVGLLDYHRNTISNTTHILHKLSVKHQDDAVKDIGVLLVQAFECPFGFN